MKTSMTSAIFVVLCFVTMTYGERCPFRVCGSYPRGREYVVNITKCETRAATYKSCIEASLLRTDICQVCSKWEFVNAALPDNSVKEMLSECYEPHCSYTNTLVCLMKAQSQNAFLFYDKSVIDNITRCLDNWKSGVPPETCISFIFGIRPPPPELGGLVQLAKKFLDEMKNGCDPVLPVARCRKHVKGIPFVTERPDEQEMKKSVDGLIQCLNVEVVKCPSCKTMASVLPYVHSVLTDMTSISPPGQSRDKARKLYKEKCSDSIENMVARFAEFFK
eukprot:GHVU01121065.1.p1 GENE.GHVU01121065.1~~GHVU01121065.1.p1  ORF type:complete len:277 (-),score=18.70 GHVU01121065.1:155-985(-)